MTSAWPLDLAKGSLHIFSSPVSQQRQEEARSDSEIVPSLQKPSMGSIRTGLLKSRHKQELQLQLICRKPIIPKRMQLHLMILPQIQLQLLSLVLQKMTQDNQHQLN